MTHSIPFSRNRQGLRHRAHPAALFALAACCGAIALSGCYDPKELTKFTQTPYRDVAGTEYRIYPPDELHFTSTTIAEISDIVQLVRPDGRVNLPLLGEIEVAGYTPEEVEDRIAQAATEYYSKTNCIVSVTKYASQRFYVFGMVERPGPLPWTGRDSLLDALAYTQPNWMAWPERILVVRGDDPKVGGLPDPPLDKDDNQYRMIGMRTEQRDRPRNIMTINMMAMIRGGDLSNNILLMPNDVVYVQPNPLAAIGLAIQQVLFPIRGASDTLYYYHQGFEDVRWIGDGHPRSDSNSRVVVR